MQIRFTARHYKAPEQIKAYAEKKILKLERYHDSILDCEIVCDYEKLNQIVEFALNVNGQKLIVIEKSDDIYKCIDEGVDKLERQLKKHKDKKKGHKDAKPDVMHTT
jgi:putative sigma-54 modulation protein